MSVDYWYLEQPDYEYNSYEKHNGKLTRKYWLPSIDCSNCGTWANLFPCPLVVDDAIFKLLDQYDKFIDMVQFSIFASKIKKLITTRARLEPGMFLFPIEIKVKKTSLHSFIWGSLFLPVVDKDILDELLQQNATGFESIETRVKYHKKLEEVYYSICVISISEVPSSIRLLETCNICGRKSYEIPDELKVESSAIPDSDIFILGGTGMIVISQRFLDILEKHSGVEKNWSATKLHVF